MIALPPTLDAIVKTYLEKAGEAPKDSAGTYQLLDDVEIESAPDPAWLVEGLLQTDTYIVLYGESGGGKSFLALDWSLCVATGMPWRGRPVKQGPVIYIGAEGRAGMKRRVQAWKRAHAYVGRAGVQFINATANVRETKTAEQLLTDIRAKLGDAQPVLIWLDTLNRHLCGGNENDSKDIGAANTTATALREATGAVVGYLHHCRSADEKERGHTSLRGAADTMAHLGIKDDGETRELKCTKQRDWSEFDPLTFRLRSEGDSLVIDDPRVLGPEELGKTDRAALEALVKLHTGTPVPLAHWLKVSKLADRTFYKVRARLVKAGHVEQPRERGGYVPAASAHLYCTAPHSTSGGAVAGSSETTARAVGGSSGAVGSSGEDTLPF